MFLEWAGVRGASLLPIGMPLSGSLSQGRGGSMEHTVNPPLDRKRSSGHDMLSFMRGTTCVLWTLLGAVVYGGISGFRLLSELEPKY